MQDRKILGGPDRQPMLFAFHKKDRQRKDAYQNGGADRRLPPRFGRVRILRADDARISERLVDRFTFVSVDDQVIAVCPNETSKLNRIINVVLKSLFICPSPKSPIE